MKIGGRLMERIGGGLRLKRKDQSKGANERAKATGTARATATTTMVVPMMRDTGLAEEGGGSPVGWRAKSTEWNCGLKRRRRGSKWRRPSERSPENARRLRGEATPHGSSSTSGW